MQPEPVNQLHQVTVQDFMQTVEGQIDPVVGHTALREVVGADLGAAVAGADQQTTAFGPFGPFRLLRLLVQA